MKALSYKQPWAWLAASGIKPIENRTWKLPDRYIGQRVLIHASAKPLFPASNFLSPLQYEEVVAQNKIHLLDRAYRECGAIIGSVEFVGCTVNHESIWAEKTAAQHCIYHTPCSDVKTQPNCWAGCVHFYKPKPIYNWILANPILFPEPILNVNGKLGFWDYDIERYEIRKLEKQI